MIYFIRSPDGPIKIGTTIRLNKLLAQPDSPAVVAARLPDGSSERVEVVGTSQVYSSIAPGWGPAPPFRAIELILADPPTTEFDPDRVDQI